MKKLTAFFLVLVLLFNLAPAVMAAGEFGDTGGEETLSETGNSILSDLTIAPASPDVTVELAAENAATVTVAMFAESGAMIGFGMADISGSPEMQQVQLTLQMHRERPEYFSLRAFLVDENWIPLCQSLDCFTYTRGFAEFLDVTEADFPGQTALCGEADNLLVLAPGVKELTAGTHFTSLSADEENGIYTLTGAAGDALQLKKGDAVWMVDENGVQHSAKVKSVSKDGNTVTITANSDAQTSDFVSFIRLDVTADQETAAANMENAELVDPEESQTTLEAVPEKPGTDLVSKRKLHIGGKFDVNQYLRVDIGGTLAFESRISIFYSPEHLESEELFVKRTDTMEYSFSGVVTGSVDNGDFNPDTGTKSEYTIDLVPDIPIPLYGGVTLHVKLSMPVVVALKGTVTIGHEAKSISTTITQNGKTQGFSHCTFDDPKLDFQVEVVGRIGLRLTLQLDLLKICHLSVSPEGGLELKIKPDFSAGTDTQGKRHICDICIKGEANAYFKLPISLWIGIDWGKKENTDSKDSKKPYWKVTLAEFTAVEKRSDMKLFHLSSLTGFNWGSCTNYDYRLRVSVYDQDNVPLTEAQVTIFNMKDYASGSHGMVDYLYPGEYQMETVCDGYETDERTLTVTQAQDVTVVLQKDDTTPYRLRVYVRGSDGVELTDADVVVFGEKGIGSGSNGTPINLPRGEYQIETSCSGYEPDTRTLQMPAHAQDVTVVLQKNEDDFDYGGTIINNPLYYWYGLRSYMVLRPSGLLTFQVNRPEEYDKNGGRSGTQPYWRQNNGNDVRWERIRTIRRVVWLDGSMTVLPNQAFENCINLQSVNINGAATPLPKRAFAFCKNLETVTGTQNVTTVGDQAFHSCAITGILDLSGAENYGYEALGYCESLDGVILGRGFLGGNAFVNCRSLHMVDLGEITSIGSSAFSGCSKLTSLDIPSSVKSIGNSAFSGSGLTSISIPESVEDIGQGLFTNCTDLVSVSINVPDVYAISNSMFSGCTSLENVSFASSVTHIRGNAFANCTAMTSFTVPDSVTNVEMYAFSGCTNLQQISIPAGLEQLDRSVFTDCPMLSRIDFRGTMEQWQALRERTYSPIDTTRITVTCTDGVIASGGVF